MMTALEIGLVFFLAMASGQNEPKVETTLPPPVALGPEARNLEVEKAKISPTTLQQPNSSCHKVANSCHHVANATCLDTKLPYDQISFDFTDLQFIWEVKSELRKWRKLKSVPKCWPVIQPLLCSVYMPRCYNDDEEDANRTTDFKTDLIPQQLCLVTQGPCRIVREMRGWPEFLQCNDTRIFSKNCNERERTKSSSYFFRFNVSHGECQDPLVPTENENSFFHDFDGCGMRCRNPLFTQEEYHSMYKRLGLISSIGAILFTFSVLTHLVAGWRNVNKYPNIIIFYLSICCLVIMVAFLMQFLPGIDDSIVCEENRTKRLESSNGSGHQLCTASFFFLYYFFLAFMLWFVILTYCWYVEASEASGIRKTLEKKSAYFHMIAWLTPFMASITLISLNLVEADSLMGVCFLSTKTLAWRISAFTVPIIAMILVSNIFNFLTFRKLRDVVSGQCVNKKDKKNTLITLAKRGLFCVAICFCGLILIIVDFYQLNYQEAWEKSLKEYVLCQTGYLALDSLEHSTLKCDLENRPNFSIIGLIPFCMVVSAVSTFAWMLGSTTLKIWKETFNHLTGRQSKKPLDDKQHKGKKHKIIQQAYAQRQQLEQNGRMSLSLPSLNTNVVIGRTQGMNLVQDTSVEFDSSFVGAIPRLVSRRNAIIELEVSEDTKQQHVQAGGSRRHSFDSQISIQPNELEHLRSLYDRTIKKKRSKRKFFNNYGGKSRSSRLRRRLSVTSGNGTTTVSDSSITASQILPALTRDLNSKFDNSSLSSSRSSLKLPSFLRGQNNFEMTNMRKSSKSRSSINFPDLMERLKHLSIDSSTNDPSQPQPQVEKRTDASIQTSFTDLSIATLQTKKTVGTQYEDNSQVSTPVPQSTTTTTSSSQTESHPLRHIEPNIIRISVPSQERSSGDSILSSYDRDLHSSSKFLLKNSDKMRKEKENLFDHPPLRTLHSEIHNRGRRGGIIDAEIEISVPNPLQTSSTS